MEHLFSPKTSVTSKMVVACFVDIRGFTTFVQSTGESLRDGIKLLNGFYDKINTAFDDASKNLSVDTEFGLQIIENARPKFCKTLGDGVMIIWEYPDSNDEDIEDGFKIFILDFIQYIQNYFYRFKSKFIYKHPFLAKALNPLNIGFGLSWGPAWKLAELDNTNVDYIGSCLNKASRLQDLARPCGLVADFTFMSNLFFERWSMNKEGAFKYHELKGFNDPELVWQAIDSPILKPRCSRSVTSFHEAYLSIDLENNLSKMGSIPLSLDDTVNIFDVRERFEAEFASETALRRKDGKISDYELEAINPQQHGETFHTGIAKLSTSNIEEGEKRCKFIDWAYRSTRRLNEHATENEKDKTPQHTRIFLAIRDGNNLLVEDLMKDHIRNACIEGQKKLVDKIKEEFNESRRKLKD